MKDLLKKASGLERRIKNIIYSALMAAGIFCLPVWILVGRELFCWLGIALLLCAMAFHKAAYRCPKCGKYLGSTGAVSDYCKSCGAGAEQKPENTGRKPWWGKEKN